MTTIKDDFDNYLSGIAWNAWRELGVAGIDRFYEDCLIQPEELIILTAIISQYDPRLRDEALDWCSRYHEYISVSRLRAFLKEMDSSTIHSFSKFAADLNELSSAKWPNMEEFPQILPKMSGKSLLPPLEAPSLLVLRLRNLFGPGAKADILTHFLTRPGIRVSASDLDAIGYSKRSVMTALDQLAASGVLFATNVKNRKNYELRKSRELQVIVGKLPKIAPPWIKILQAIVIIRAIIPELQNASQLTKGVILRNCLIKIEPLLPMFISSILQNKPDFEQDEKSIMKMFKGFQQGNFFMQFDVPNEFDTIVIQLLGKLYQLDDCVDGLETIQDKVQFKDSLHREIYKECYQLFLSFVGDLRASLKLFLEFPFHQMMDEAVSEIAYRFTKEKLPQLVKKMDQIQSIDRITSAQLAIRQYQFFMPELDELRQFIYTFRKRLEALYFVRTDIHLLSLPTKLYKRHLVLDLFSKEVKS